VRLSLKIGFFLFSGALVSQLVALACYVFAGTGRATLLPLSPRERVLPGFLRSWPQPDSGTIEDDVLLGHRRVILRCPVSAPPDFRDDPPKYALYVDSFGWPARALVMYHAGVFIHGSNGGTIDLIAFYDDFGRRAGLGKGLQRPRWFPQRAGWPEIPCVTVWSALLLNAVAYAALGWVCVNALASGRRRWRARRGRCVQCGYTLAGLSRCPECGGEAESRPRVVSADSGA
jgi:hypothetical protein